MGHALLTSVRVTILVAVFSIWPTHSRAEPIQITDGHMLFSTFGCCDFKVDVTLPGLGHWRGDFPNETQLLLFGITYEIRPDSVVNLSGRFSGAGSGSGSLDGVGLSSNVSGTFTTPAAVLEPSREGFTGFNFPALVASAPFAMEGFVTLRSQEFGTTLFEGAIFGAGQARATYFQRSRLGGPYLFAVVNYTFDDAGAVPEPGSLLLLGTALGGLWVRQRRMRQRLN